MGGGVEKRGIINSGIPSPDMKLLEIIPLGNEPQYRNKNPTVSSGDSLRIETSKIHKLKSYTNLQLKYKESTPSSLNVASTWVSIELYCTYANQS